MEAVSFVYMICTPWASSHMFYTHIDCPIKFQTGQLSGANYEIPLTVWVHSARRNSSRLAVCEFTF